MSGLLETELWHWDGQSIVIALVFLGAAVCAAVVHVLLIVHYGPFAKRVATS